MTGQLWMNWSARRRRVTTGSSHWFWQLFIVCRSSSATHREVQNIGLRHLVQFPVVNESPLRYSTSRTVTVEPCSLCKAPTSLYYKGTPICVDCERKFYTRHTPYWKLGIDDKVSTQPVKRPEHTAVACGKS